MKKSYRLDGLDCAACVAKMEAAIGKLDGVERATVSFATARMTIEARAGYEDTVLEEAKRIIGRFEPGVRVRPI